MTDKRGAMSSTGIKRLIGRVFLIAVIVAVIWYFWTGKKDKVSAPGAGVRAGMSGEATMVRVHKVAAKEIRNTREYIGRIEAVDSVDLVARVSGYLKSIDFKEGGKVNAGDLMFTIEKKPFRAEVDARKGTVLQIEANLVQAQKYLNRLKSAKAESVPESDIESAQRDVDYNSAQLVSAKANLELAEIDLSYTAVTAPVSGRVTKKNYSAGDYVGPGSGTIASVIKTDPVRVVCSMSEVEYINLMERSGSSPEKIFRPALRLPNGSLYEEEGGWDFADPVIDNTTGTISLRSRYSNPSGLLIPGGYVTVKLSPVKGETLPLVPQAAVMEGRDGSYVYVVDKENTVQMRPIKKGSSLETDWIVYKGIEPGETIILEGIQKVRPGQKVNIMNGPSKAVSGNGGK